MASPHSPVESSRTSRRPLGLAENQSSTSGEASLDPGKRRNRTSFSTKMSG